MYYAYVCTYVQTHHLFTYNTFGTYNTTCGVPVHELAADLVKPAHVAVVHKQVPTTPDHPHPTHMTISSMNICFVSSPLPVPASFPSTSLFFFHFNHFWGKFT